MTTSTLGVDASGLYLDAPDAIHLYSGGRIRPLDPDPNDIRIEDIAHALSNQCRFTGHTTKFTSVAEHCVRVSWLVDEELKLEALLHDASEAYLADLARPIKRAPGFGDVYTACERVLEKAITARFGLPVREEMHPDIKWADHYALEAEVATFCHPNFQEAMGVAHKSVWVTGVIPSGWAPTAAEQAFLESFHLYSKEPV